MILQKLEVALERGPRRLLAWGGVLFMHALGAMFCVKFWNGTATLADLAVVIPPTLTLMQWLYSRHTERMGNRT